MKKLPYLIICLLLSISASAQKEIFDDIGKKLVSIETPETAIASKKDFYYFELLKIDIDENSKILYISVSDSSAMWLRKGVEKIIKTGILDLAKLNSRIKGSRLKSCSLILPVVIASEFYSTNMAGKAPLLNEMLFKFNGKNLGGNLIFGDPYIITHGSNWHP